MSNQRRRKPRTFEEEVASRLRRIETRVTQLLVVQGIDAGEQKPIFQAGRMILPSPHSSMKEILDNIPKTWEGPVAVFVGDEQVAVVDRPRNGH